MDPILKALLDTFIGGELEIRGLSEEGYVYRGQIATITIVEETKTTFGSLLFGLDWNTRALGWQSPHHGLVRNGRWEEITKLEYCCNTEQSTSKINSSNNPKVQFRAEQLIIRDTQRAETVIVFPATADKLRHDKVEWLPDGPKAAYDAAQRQKKK
ncbi:MAG TPA: hypothetical protein VLG40_00785 [Candidatus Saccharimonas sp.]|nr:hypothetical protein [Candidatus Saccharimonas sp.]